MKKMFMLPLLMLCGSLLGASDKIGLDRIDAAVGKSASVEWAPALMRRTAETGVRHIKIWAPWTLMNPVSSMELRPREISGTWVVPGIRLLGWHRYYVGDLDRAMAEARAHGLEVTLGIHGPPQWPRGEDVCAYDFGTHQPCGFIAQTHFEIFKNALYDFSFYLAKRYPDVKHWIVYNEPNLPYAFLPEKPYPGGTLLTAYMELVYWPIADGIRHTGSTAGLVGPEITLQNVENEFGDTRWFEDWILPLAEGYPNHFDVIGVHSYTVDAHQTLEKMRYIKKVLVGHPYATQRVWLTEFNFGTGKELLTRTPENVFINLLTLYSNQWWERSYFFSLLGPLVHDEGGQFGAPKPLYSLFSLLVRHMP